MPDLLNLESALLAQAFNSRWHAQARWSKKSVCPGYTFDRNNPAWGQCGVTRNAYLERLDRFTFAAAVLTDVMRRDEITVYARDGQPELVKVEQHFQFDSPEAIYLLQWWELMKNRRLMCVFGGGTDHSGRKFSNHCWAQVVEPGQEGRPDVGIVADPTLGQFGPHLPAVLVQAAQATDSPVEYQPERYELYGEHDTAALNMDERFAYLWGGPSSESLKLWSGPAALAL